MVQEEEDGGGEREGSQGSQGWGSLHKNVLHAVDFDLNINLAVCGVLETKGHRSNFAGNLHVIL
jgi:hypothetical protein